MLPLSTNALGTSSLKDRLTEVATRSVEEIFNQDNQDKIQQQDSCLIWVSKNLID
jgi:hypothetical protein